MDDNAPKFSILIVDDDLGIIETMADILGEKDFIVTTASDGFKAIEIFKEKHFDAIIMDVRMPGIDGVETFKKMKKIKELKGTHNTIFITAFALEDLIREAKAEGAIAVFLNNIWQVQRLLATKADPIAEPLELNEFLGKTFSRRFYPYMSPVAANP